jgi:hypothetical protein
MPSLARMCLVVVLFASAVAPTAEAQVRRVPIGSPAAPDGSARTLGNCCGLVFGLALAAAILIGGFKGIQSLATHQSDRGDRGPVRRKRKRKRRRRDDDDDDDPGPRVRSTL